MKQGIPVVMVDRRIASDNFVTFVTASDQMEGRLGRNGSPRSCTARATSSSSAAKPDRAPTRPAYGAAMQVLDQYPDIKILDTVYSDWSPVKASR